MFNLKLLLLLIITNICLVYSIFFDCGNGKYIGHYLTCDGLDDCGNWADELSCTKSPSAKTRPVIVDESLINCNDSYNTCIPNKWLCDGLRDCSNGNDEMNCTKEKSCSKGFSLGGSDNTTCIDINECDDILKGQCSQECINTYGGYKCKCSEGYKLINNRSCIAAEEEPLLFFSNSKGIRGFWLRSKQFFPVYQTSKQTIGIDFLAKKDRVYWIELDSSYRVYSTTLMVNYFKTIVTKGLKAPEDLAIDWVGENIYISDGELNKIIVCNIDGDICASDLFGVLDKPRAIVVDPSNGTIYWTEWGEHPGIYVAGMDGSNKHHLINNNLIRPNGITLDSVTNRLYWSDVKISKIEYLDLKTNQRVIVISDKVFYPFSLDVFEDWIYWSDWATDSLDKSYKLTGHNQTVLIRDGNEKIMSLHIYHPLIQKQSYNPCFVHHCSHLCVLAPNRRHTCVCPDNLVLSKDKKTCENRSKIINIQQFLNDQQIFMDRTDNDHSDIDENESNDIIRDWLMFGIVVVIIVLIAVFVFIFVKRDDYRVLPNVIYIRNN